MSKPLIIYHKNCADGFGAAWAAYRKFGEDGAEYLALEYNSSKEETLDMGFSTNRFGRDIYILDFSFSPEVMYYLRQLAKSITWLDHHKSAFIEHGYSPEKRVEQSTAGYGEAWTKTVLDPDKSGCVLAWEEFCPGLPVPMILQLIQDRDLWEFKLAGTKAFHMALSCFPYSFENFNLANEEWETLIISGTIMQGLFENQVTNLAKTSQALVLEGVECQGRVVNAPKAFSSELGSVLAMEGAFGATWFVNSAGEVEVSLRSVPGFDVSVIAKSFGGGGHATAAGFKTKLENLVFKQGVLHICKQPPVQQLSKDDLERALGWPQCSLIKVSDGFVTTRDAVWWKEESGPKKVRVNEHLENIGEFPGLYSIAEPKFRLVYE